MIRLARVVAALAGWRRYGLALLLGAAAGTAFAPLYALPILPVAFTGLMWLLDGAKTTRGRFALVWTFAWGHYIVCFYWIAYAFFVDADQFGWLVPAPVLGLPALIALFPGVTVSVALRFAAGGPGRIAAVALAWTLADWLREWVLTGFPWDLLGYVWTGLVPMMQAAALFGVLGLGLITAAVAALPSLLGARGIRDRGVWAWVGGGVALLVLLWVGGSLRLANATVATVPDVTLRLVQPNIPQRWRPSAAELQADFERYLQLSSEAGAERVNVWIWPESAVPYFIDRDFGALRVLEDFVRGHGLLLTGADRVTPPDAPEFKAWVSLRAIDDKGIIASYDKHHLVPYGEYLPMRPLLSRIGLRKLTNGTVDFSSGTDGTVLHLPGLPPVRPLICYEDIFPDEVADGGGRPGWLLNISNDSWFGDSAGPYQHFATSRLRAVEQGLPLIRVTITGISAVVDPYGRILERLGLDQSGIIDTTLPAALAPTPYARFGDWMLLPLAAILLALVRLFGRETPIIDVVTQS